MQWAVHVQLVLLKHIPCGTVTVKNCCAKTWFKICPVVHIFTTVDPTDPIHSISLCVVPQRLALLPRSTKVLGSIPGADFRKEVCLLDTVPPTKKHVSGQTHVTLANEREDTLKVVNL